MATLHQLDLFLYSLCTNGIVLRRSGCILDEWRWICNPQIPCFKLFRKQITATNHNLKSNELNPKQIEPTEIPIHRDQIREIAKVTPNHKPWRRTMSGTLLSTLPIQCSLTLRSLQLVPPTAAPPKRVVIIYRLHRIRNQRNPRNHLKQRNHRNRNRNRVVIIHQLQAIRMSLKTLRMFRSNRIKRKHKMCRFDWALQWVQRTLSLWSRSGRARLA